MLKVGSVSSRDLHDDANVLRAQQTGATIV